MFTVNLVPGRSGAESTSLECCSYSVYHRDDGSVMVSMQNAPPASGHLELTLEKKQRAYMMNRYGNTHEIINGSDNHKTS